MREGSSAYQRLVALYRGIIRRDRIRNLKASMYPQATAPAGDMQLQQLEGRLMLSGDIDLSRAQQLASAAQQAIDLENQLTVTFDSANQQSSNNVLSNKLVGLDKSIDGLVGIGDVLGMGDYVQLYLAKELSVNPLPAGAPDYSDTGGAPTLDGLVGFLNSQWLPKVGIGQVGTLSLDTLSDGAQISFVADGTYSDTVHLALGSAAKDTTLQFAMPLQLSANIDVDMAMALRFSWDGAVATADLDHLNFDVQAHPTDLTGSATYGPLAVNIGKSGGVEGSADLDLSGAVSVEGGDLTLSPGTSQLTASLPIYSDLAGVTVAGGSTPPALGVSSGLLNYSAGPAPAPTVQTSGFDVLRKFDALNISRATAMVTGVQTWLKNLSKSGGLSTAVPFTSAGVGGLLDFAGGYAGQVLSKLDLAHDHTLQDLVADINHSPSVLAQGRSITYNPGTQRFTIPLQFQQTLSGSQFNNVPLNLALDLGNAGLSNLSTSARANLSADVGGQVDLVIDFTSVVDPAQDQPLLEANNAQATGHLSFDASNFAAQASLGFVHLTAGGSQTAAHVALTSTVSPQGAGDHFVNLQDLVSQVAPTPYQQNLSGSATLSLANLNAGSIGLPIDSSKQISLVVSNPSQPTKATATLPNLGASFEMQHLTLATITAAITKSASFVQQALATQPFYTQSLPLLNQRLSDVLNVVGQFSGKIQAASRISAAAIQDVAGAVENALGVANDQAKPANQRVFALVPDGQVLDVHIDWSALLNTTAGFSLDVKSLAQLAGGVQGLDGLSQFADPSAKLAVQASANLEVDMGIDFSDINNPDTFFYDHGAANAGSFAGTHLGLGLSVTGQNLNMNLGFQDLQIGVHGGSAALTADGNPAHGPATLTTNLASGNTNGRFHLGVDPLGSSLQSNTTGALAVNLPVTLNILGKTVTPTPSSIQIGGALGPVLQKTAGSVQITTPDITGAFSNAGGVLSLGGLLNDPGFLLSGFDGALSSVQTVVAASLGADLPLIGSKLSQSGDFLRDMRTRLEDELRGRLSDDGQAIARIAQALSSVLGPSGMNILQGSIGVAWYDKAGNKLKDWSAGDPLPLPSDTADAIQFNVPLGGTIATSSINIPLALHLPGFSLDVHGGFTVSLPWSFNLGLGVSLSDGFYLATGANPELNVGISATLSNGFSADGRLLFLNAHVTDAGIPDPNNTDQTRPSGFYGGLAVKLNGGTNHRLTMADLAAKGVQAFDPVLSSDAGLDLHVTLNVAAGLPGLAGDLMVSWNNNSAEVDLRNLAVDVGSFFGNFLSPIAEKLNDVLSPIAPIVDDLTKDISPVLDTMLSPLIKQRIGRDGPANLENIINFFQDLQGNPLTDWTFINAVGQIINLTGEIASASHTGLIPLGDILNLGSDNQSFTYPGGASTWTTPSDPNITKFQGFGSGLATASGMATPAIDAGGDGLDFHYLWDISNWMKLLTGGDATLFTYQMPPLTLDVSASSEASIMPFPPIPVSLDLGFSLGAGVTANLKFGYDTKGIRDAIATGNPLHVFDGFYLDNTLPQLLLNASLGLSADVSAVAVAVGLSGTLSFDANVTLADLPAPHAFLLEDAAGKVANYDELVADPNTHVFTDAADGISYGWSTAGDGKVRASEIAALWDFGGLSSLANVDAALNLVINAWVKVGVKIPFVGEVMKTVYDQDLVNTTLWSTKYTAAQPVPVLGSVDGNGVLTLNTGPLAAQRQYVDTSASGETIKLLGDSGDILVIFNGDWCQEFHNVTKVVATAGSGNETFDATYLHVPVDFTGDTTPGDSSHDTLIAGPAGGTLRGGVGANLLDGRRATAPVTIIGTSGDDTIYGGSGGDLLQGGAGRTIVRGGGGNADTIASGAGLDTLYDAAGTGHTYRFTPSFNVDVFQDPGAGSILDFSQVTQALTLTIDQTGITVDLADGSEMRTGGASISKIILGGGANNVIVNDFPVGDLTIQNSGGTDQYAVRLGLAASPRGTGTINVVDTGGGVEQIVAQQVYGYTPVALNAGQIANGREVLNYDSGLKKLTVTGKGALLDGDTIVAQGGKVLLNTTDASGVSDLGSVDFHVVGNAVHTQAALLDTNDIGITSSTLVVDGTITTKDMTWTVSGTIADNAVLTSTGTSNLATSAAATFADQVNLHDSNWQISGADVSFQSILNEIAGGAAHINALGTGADINLSADVESSTSASVTDGHGAGSIHLVSDVGSIQFAQAQTQFLGSSALFALSARGLGDTIRSTAGSMTLITTGTGPSADIHVIESDDLTLVGEDLTADHSSGVASIWSGTGTITVQLLATDSRLTLASGKIQTAAWGKDITLIADDIDFRGGGPNSVIGTGNLFIRSQTEPWQYNIGTAAEDSNGNKPQDAGQYNGQSDAVSRTNSMNFATGDIAALKDGFAAIQFGRQVSGQSVASTMYTGNATFHDPVTFYGGDMYVWGKMDFKTDQANASGTTATMTGRSVEVLLGNVHPNVGSELGGIDAREIHFNATDHVAIAGYLKARDLVDIEAGQSQAPGGVSVSLAKFGSITTDHDSSAIRVNATYGFQNNLGMVTGGGTDSTISIAAGTSFEQDDDSSIVTTGAYHDTQTASIALSAGTRAHIGGMVLGGVTATSDGQGHVTYHPVGIGGAIIAFTSGQGLTVTGTVVSSQEIRASAGADPSGVGIDVTETSLLLTLGAGKDLNITSTQRIRIEGAVEASGEGANVVVDAGQQAYISGSVMGRANVGISGGADSSGTSVLITTPQQLILKGVLGAGDAAQVVITGVNDVQVDGIVSAPGAGATASLSAGGRILVGGLVQTGKGIGIAAGPQPAQGSSVTISSTGVVSTASDGGAINVHAISGQTLGDVAIAGTIEMDGAGSALHLQGGGDFRFEDGGLIVTKGSNSSIDIAANGNALLNGVIRAGADAADAVIAANASAKVAVGGRMDVTGAVTTTGPMDLEAGADGSGVSLMMNGTLRVLQSNALLQLNGQDDVVVAGNVYVNVQPGSTGGGDLSITSQRQVYLSGVMQAKGHIRVIGGHAARSAALAPDWALQADGHNTGVLAPLAYLQAHSGGQTITSDSVVFHVVATDTNGIPYDTTVTLTRAATLANGNVADLAGSVQQALAAAGLATLNADGSYSGMTVSHYGGRLVFFSDSDFALHPTQNAWELGMGQGDVLAAPESVVLAYSASLDARAGDGVFADLPQQDPGSAAAVYIHGDDRVEITGQLTTGGSGSDIVIDSGQRIFIDDPVTAQDRILIAGGDDPTGTSVLLSYGSGSLNSTGAGPGAVKVTGTQDVVVMGTMNSAHAGGAIALQAGGVLRVGGPSIDIYGGPVDLGATLNAAHWVTLTGGHDADGKSVIFYAPSKITTTEVDSSVTVSALPGDADILGTMDLGHGVTDKQTTLTILGGHHVAVGQGLTAGKQITVQAGSQMDASSTDPSVILYGSSSLQTTAANSNITIGGGGWLRLEGDVTADQPGSTVTFDATLGNPASSMIDVVGNVLAYSAINMNSVATGDHQIFLEPGSSLTTLDGGIAFDTGAIGNVQGDVTAGKINQATDASMSIHADQALQVGGHIQAAGNISLTAGVTPASDGTYSVTGTINPLIPSLDLQRTSIVSLADTGGKITVAGLGDVLLDDTIKTSDPTSSIELASVQGALLLTHDYGRILAAGALHIGGQDLQLNGVIRSTADLSGSTPEVDIDTAGSVEMNGEFVAEGSIRVHAGQDITVIANAQAGARVSLDASVPFTGDAPALAAGPHTIELQATNGTLTLGGETSMSGYMQNIGGHLIAVDGVSLTAGNQLLINPAFDVTTTGDGSRVDIVSGGPLTIAGSVNAGVRPDTVNGTFVRTAANADIYIVGHGLIALGGNGWATAQDHTDDPSVAIGSSIARGASINASGRIDLTEPQRIQDTALSINDKSALRIVTDGSASGWAGVYDIDIHDINGNAVLAGGAFAPNIRVDTSGTTDDLAASGGSVDVNMMMSAAGRLTINAGVDASSPSSGTGIDIHAVQKTLQGEYTGGGQLDAGPAGLVTLSADGNIYVEGLVGAPRSQALGDIVLDRALLTSRHGSVVVDQEGVVQAVTGVNVDATGDVLLPDDGAIIGRGAGSTVNITAGNNFTVAHIQVADRSLVQAEHQVNITAKVLSVHGGTVRTREADSNIALTGHDQVQVFGESDQNANILGQVESGNTITVIATNGDVVVTGLGQLIAHAGSVPFGDALTINASGSVSIATSPAQADQPTVVGDGVPVRTEVIKPVQDGWELQENGTTTETYYDTVTKTYLVQYGTKSVVVGRKYYEMNLDLTQIGWVNPNEVADPNTEYVPGSVHIYQTPTSADNHLHVVYQAGQNGQPPTPLWVMDSSGTVQFLPVYRADYAEASGRLHDIENGQDTVTNEAPAWAHSTDYRLVSIKELMGSAWDPNSGLNYWIEVPYMQDVGDGSDSVHQIGQAVQQSQQSYFATVGSTHLTSQSTLIQKGWYNTADGTFVEDTGQAVPDGPVHDYEQQAGLPTDLVKMGAAKPAGPNWVPWYGYAAGSSQQNVTIYDSRGTYTYTATPPSTSSFLQTQTMVDTDGNVLSVDFPAYVQPVFSQDGVATGQQLIISAGDNIATATRNLHVMNFNKVLLPADQRDATYTDSTGIFPDWMGAYTETVYVNSDSELPPLHAFRQGMYGEDELLQILGYVIPGQENPPPHRFDLTWMRETLPYDHRTPAYDHVAWAPETSSGSHATLSDGGHSDGLANYEIGVSYDTPVVTGYVWQYQGHRKDVGVWLTAPLDGFTNPHDQWYSSVQWSYGASWSGPEPTTQVNNVFYFDPAQIGQSIISLGRPHNFGDIITPVIYHCNSNHENPGAPPTIGLPGDNLGHVSGLVDGTMYYALETDATHVQLYATYNDAASWPRHPIAISGAGASGSQSLVVVQNNVADGRYTADYVKVPVYETRPVYNYTLQYQSQDVYDLRQNKVFHVTTTDQPIIGQVPNYVLEKHTDVVVRYATRTNWDWVPHMVDETDYEYTLAGEPPTVTQDQFKSDALQADHGDIRITAGQGATIQARIDAAGVNAVIAITADGDIVVDGAKETGASADTLAATGHLQASGGVVLTSTNRSITVTKDAELISSGGMLIPLHTPDSVNSVILTAGGGMDLSGTVRAAQSLVVSATDDIAFEGQVVAGSASFQSDGNIIAGNVSADPSQPAVNGSIRVNNSTGVTMTAGGTGGIALFNATIAGVDDTGTPVAADITLSAPGGSIRQTGLAGLPRSSAGPSAGPQGIGRTMLITGGTLTATALHDISLQGISVAHANVATAGTGDASIQQYGDLSLDNASIADGSLDVNVKGSVNADGTTNADGSLILGTIDVTGGSVTAQAAQSLTANQVTTHSAADISLKAGGDMTLDTIAAGGLARHVAGADVSLQTNGSLTQFGARTLIADALTATLSGGTTLSVIAHSLTLDAGGTGPVTVNDAIPDTVTLTHVSVKGGDFTFTGADTIIAADVQGLSGASLATPGDILVQSIVLEDNVWGQIVATGKVVLSAGGQIAAYLPVDGQQQIIADSASLSAGSSIGPLQVDLTALVSASAGTGDITIADVDLPYENPGGLALGTITAGGNIDISSTGQLVVGAAVQGSSQASANGVQPAARPPGGDPAPMTIVGNITAPGDITLTAGVVVSGAGNDSQSGSSGHDLIIAGPGSSPYVIPMFAGGGTGGGDSVSPAANVHAGAGLMLHSDGNVVLAGNYSSDRLLEIRADRTILARPYATYEADTVVLDTGDTLAFNGEIRATQLARLNTRGGNLLLAGTIAGRTSAGVRQVSLTARGSRLPSYYWQIGGMDQLADEQGKFYYQNAQGKLFSFIDYNLVDVTDQAPSHLLPVIQQSFNQLIDPITQLPLYTDEDGYVYAYNQDTGNFYSWSAGFDLNGSKIYRFTGVGQHGVTEDLYASDPLVTATTRFYTLVSQGQKQSLQEVPGPSATYSHLLPSYVPAGDLWSHYVWPYYGPQSLGNIVVLPHMSLQVSANDLVSIHAQRALLGSGLQATATGAGGFVDVHAGLFTAATFFGSDHVNIAADQYFSGDYENYGVAGGSADLSGLTLTSPDTGLPTPRLFVTAAGGITVGESLDVPELISLQAGGDLTVNPDVVFSPERLVVSARGGYALNTAVAELNLATTGNGDATVNQTGAVTVTGVNIADGQFALNAGDTTVTGPIAVNGPMDLHVRSLAVHSPVSSTGAASVTATHGFTSDGSLHSGDRLHIRARQMQFTPGSLSAVNGVTLVYTAPATLNPLTLTGLTEGVEFTAVGTFTDYASNGPWTGTVNWGDGTAEEPLTIDASAQSFPLDHTYAEGGNYSVVLSITNGLDLVGTQQQQIAVADPAPTLTLPAIAADSAGRLLASGSFDPAGDACTATVDYGDGAGPQPLSLNSDQTFSLDHQYSREGTFTLTVSILDDDGQAASETRTLTVAPPILTAPGPDNAYVVSPDSTNNFIQVFANGDSTALGIYEKTGVSSITIRSAGGNDVLSIDPAVTASVVYDARGNHGSLAVQGGPAILRGAADLAGLTLATGAMVSLPAGGSAILVTDSLSIAQDASGAPLAKLNLRDNALVVRSGVLGEWDPATSRYTGLTGLLAAAFASGQWNGNGIQTTAAALDPGMNRGLGILTAGEAAANGNAALLAPNAFRGQTVANNDVLVQLGWNGDMNFDGQVNYLDYGAIDNAYLYNQAHPSAPRRGYANGDLNFDGAINYLDYGMMDNAFLAINAPHGSAASAAAATAPATSLFATTPMAMKPATKDSASILTVADPSVL